MPRQSASPLLFAQVDHRARRGEVFGILPEDMLRHVAIIGKTGSGKSVLLERLVLADLEAGRGLALIDPHGDLVERVRALVPRRRKNDVLLLDPSRVEHALPMNMFGRVSVARRAQAASGIVSAFRKAYPESWGPRTQHIFLNAVLALLGVRGATLLDVPRLLLDERYRWTIVRQVSDPVVRQFFELELPGYGKSFGAEVVAPVLNKVGAAIASPALRAVLGTGRNRIDCRRLMDRSGVLLANLAKGSLGEEPSVLLGALLLAQIQLAAYSRFDTTPAARRQFHVYVDETGSLATTAFGEMLSEARKFGVGVVLACQYLGQLDERLRDAALGNVGTLICFRLGASDAETIGAEFEPEITARDLMRLGEHQIALRLSVGGVTSVPFTATTLPPTAAGPTRLARRSAEHHT